MSKKPERLYGLSMSENLELDIDTVVEKLKDDLMVGTFEVEEWSVCDTRSLLPSSDRMIEYMIESADPVTEDWWENAENAASDPEVQGAFDAALDLFASKVKFWMADKKLATHHVKIGDEPDE